tara:strand:- start:330 stop:806 length:477 start_codon:yes stop_codon:yes gene_type:complete
MSLFLRLNPLLLLMLISSTTIAQLSIEQIEQIETVDRTNHEFDPRRPQFMKIGNNAVTRYNPVSLVFSGSLFIYQKFLSPQLASHCPYQISCSAFCKGSIEEFGLIKGVALSADRLTRCTQFTLIDILPSQINASDGYIIDPVIKYALPKRHRHKHKH